MSTCALMNVKMSCYEDSAQISFSEVREQRYCIIALLLTFQFRAKANTYSYCCSIKYLSVKETENCFFHISCTCWGTPKIKCQVKIRAYPFSDSKTLSLHTENMAFCKCAITMLSHPLIEKQYIVQIIVHIRSISTMRANYAWKKKWTLSMTRG